MQRFQETGLIADLTLEELKLLVNSLEPRSPRGAKTIRQRHADEVAWLISLSRMQLGIWAEYMRRNMTPKDTIIYEGAMIEWCLPELIRRVQGTDEVDPTIMKNGKELVIRVLTALKEGRDIRW